MKIETERLRTIAFLGLIIWCCYPLISMVFNFFGTDVNINYAFWMTVFFFAGGFGVLAGVLYLYNLIAENHLTFQEAMKAFLPFLMILVFGIWSVICALASKHPFAAFFGYSTIKDTITAWFAYTGFIFLGYVLSSDKAKKRLLIDVFVGVSVFLALIAILDNGLTKKLCVNGYTNAFHYQSVFYNTNHYSYYLVMAALAAAFLFVYEKPGVKKICYLAAFALQTVVLVKNDTMGSYLALLLTLVFAVVWFIFNKDGKNEIKCLLILFAVFIGLSVVINLSSGSLGKSISAMFSDAGTFNDAIFGDVDKQEFSKVGSNRGRLWKMYWDVMLMFPVMGVGPENVSFSAHNNFLQIGAFTGFPGLILYLLIFIIGAIRLFQNRKTLTHTEKASAFIVVGYLIAIFFGVTMFYTAPYFYAALGFCMPGAIKINVRP